MYDRLLDFIGKYTKDRFTLNSKNIRVSAISIIAREMVLNSLMHRNITDGHTSRVIIYKDKMIMENPNSFCTMGYLTVHNYIPVAKNPTLAKFFREIGYADELGSGMKRITENTILYSGKPPIMEDKEMFRITIPLTRDRAYDEIELKELVEEEMNGNRNNVNDSVNSDEKKVLEILEKYPSISSKEISEKTGYSLSKVFRIYNQLKEKNFIERKGSDKKGIWIVKKENNFLSSSDSVNSSVSDSENDSVNLAEITVLKIMRSHPSISSKEMSEKTGYSLSKVFRIYNQLKEKNFIERKGSDKKGIWIVRKKE